MDVNWSNCTVDNSDYNIETVRVLNDENFKSITKMSMSVLLSNPQRSMGSESRESLTCVEEIDIYKYKPSVFLVSFSW